MMARSELWTGLLDDLTVAVVAMGAGGPSNDSPQGRSALAVLQQDLQAPNVVLAFDPVYGRWWVVRVPRGRN